jgi:hypothetical protein
MIKYAIDEKGLLHPVLNPLVYTIVYGDDVYYSCMGLLLQSLFHFGKYRGTVAVFSDRDRESFFRTVPDTIRPQVQHFPLADSSHVGRYSSLGEGFLNYGPIIHIDNDVVVDKDISPFLAAIVMQAGICVTTEIDSYQELQYDSVSRVQDVRRIGNWWSLEILRSDPDCANELCPMANGGIIGYRDYDAFSAIARVITELYHHPSHSEIARYFGDQPFLNYALVKTGLGSYQVLRDACNLLGNFSPSMPRGFAHFLWARGEDKFRYMQNYMQELQHH